MRLRTWVALFSTVLVAAACGPAQPTPYAITTGDGQVWDLVWSDEFDYKGLPDPHRWGYEVGFVRNDELQYYTEARKENAHVEDGMLIITSRKEPYEGADYTSASVTTKETANWTYGRLEVRAKLPSGIGMWPAIWTLGANIDDVGWPACGEIDIMENVGFDPLMIHGTVHSDFTEADTGAEASSHGNGVPIQDVSKTFHVYAIEWFPDRVDFFVDDHLYYTYRKAGTGVDVWPFDQPQYLIINAAIGGTWGGQYGVVDTIFPQTYEIDYVRIYQARG